MLRSVMFIALISIHALLAESDGNWAADTGVTARFLSTLSLRRATYCLPSFQGADLFLSTLSLRRATFTLLGTPDTWTISIHALLAESDVTGSESQKLILHFYPRSPCGERHHYGWSWYDDFTISIHALLAESDQAYSNIGSKRLIISIHALLAESDVCAVTIVPACGAFLSTLSLRRATHAGWQPWTVRRYFYPRSPCGERRPHSKSSWQRFCISIHALLAESDAAIGNPTLEIAYFYPRSPCGERQGFATMECVGL